MLSFQPGLGGSNDIRVGRKMSTFQLFFQSGRAKDLSAPLYISNQFASLLLVRAGGGEGYTVVINGRTGSGNRLLSEILMNL